MLIYVQAIVFSTTDLNLLYSVDGLKLPIIDITVPLVGFYAVIPIFIIALHFNYLQNLESHHNKLMRWQDAHPGSKVPRTSIQPFLFDFAILEEKGQMKDYVTKANNLLCYNFAPITLGLLLIRYSDRQDYIVTIIHYLAFVFDVWLVWKLRLAIVDNKKPQPSSTTVATIRGFVRDIPREGLRGGFGLVVFTVTLGTVFIGWTDGETFVAHVQPIIQPVEEARSKLIDWKPSEGSRLDNNFFKAHLLPFLGSATQIVARPLEWVLPRIAVDPTEIIWKPDDKAMHMDADLADKSTDWVKYFKDNGKGFLPTVHSLRFASLPQQNLRKAQLRLVRLQGADLWEAQLQGADLGRAQLQGVDLEEAQLQGADLWGAQLQGADLGGGACKGL